MEYAILFFVLYMVLGAIRRALQQQQPPKPGDKSPRPRPVEERFPTEQREEEVYYEDVYYDGYEGALPDYDDTRPERREEEAPTWYSDKPVVNETGRPAAASLLSDREKPAASSAKPFDGRITPDAVVNGFIWSQILGRPGGHRTQKRLNNYRQ